MQKVFAAASLVLLCAGTTQAGNVEVYVTDMLDNVQDGYCLDIAKAQGANANPEDGLQAHTCYSPSGEIFVDQAFDPDQFSDGTFYMPEFDVCMTVASVEAGAALELAACDGSEVQSWRFESEGTIGPASAPELCLSLGEETRTGRSPTNQMKALTLDACSDASVTWAYRSVE
ncbi:MAG: ricin-type beta-trefoil lectin domain protein [Shimia sp.]|jgi:hypothetical protein|uniref:ricin-type beta-trefoil lectin domain protein n=1 Tax=Shimia sp. TaxID=1954381 RepID=UPI0040590D36